MSGFLLLFVEIGDNGHCKLTSSELRRVFGAINGSTTLVSKTARERELMTNVTVSDVDGLGEKMKERHLT